MDDLLDLLAQLDEASRDLRFRVRIPYHADLAAKAKATISTLIRERDDARSVLSCVEWNNFGEKASPRKCPFCFHHFGEPHHEKCALAAELRARSKEPDRK